MQNCRRKAPDNCVQQTDSHGDSSISPPLRCVCVCVCVCGGGGGGEETQFSSELPLLNHAPF